MVVYDLDGTKIVDRESFYDEASKKLILGRSWGRNRDAFNDILRGGFGTPEGSFVLQWSAAAKARAAFGGSDIR